MNAELQSAVDRVADLPDAEQIRMARWLQAELDDEVQWQQQFATDPSLLLKLAADATAEDDRGQTRPWPATDR